MSFAKKSLSLFNREVLFSVLGLGVNVMVARTLGPVGIGLWAVFDLLNNYGRVFGGPRLEIASVYFLNQKKYDRGVILFLTNVVTLACGLALSAILLSQAGFLQRVLFKGGDVETIVLLLVLCHLPLLFLKRNYFYFLLSREDTRSYNRMMVLQEVVNPGVSFVLLMFFDWGLKSLAVGMLSGSAAALIYGFVQAHRVEKMKPSFDVRLLVDMFRFSMKVYASEAMGFLNNYLSNSVAALSLPLSSLAFFSMGKGKAEWLNRITNAVATILYPRVANLKGSDQDPSSMTTMAVRLSLLILLLAGLGLAIVIYPATLVLYGKDFLSLIPCFFILLPALIIHSATSVLRQHFLGIGRSDIPMKISVVPLILQVVLCLTLIPPWGYIGAASAVALTFTVTTAITVMAYHKVSRVGYSKLLIPEKSDFFFLVRFIKEQILQRGLVLRRVFSRPVKPKILHKTQELLP